MIRVEEKIATARKIKAALSPQFKVRRGRAYVFCQCVQCTKIFEVPYKKRECLFALGIIEAHVKRCRVDQNGFPSTT